MPVELTSLARVHLLLVRHAERQGIAREELLPLAGLSEDLLEDPDARLPSTGVLRLWQLLVGRLRDPALGVHLLEGVQLRELGLVLFILTVAVASYSPSMLFAYFRSDLADAFFSAEALIGMVVAAGLIAWRGSKS